MTQELAVQKTSALQEARQMLAAEETKRVETCKQMIQTVLDKYRCVLDVSVVLRPGQVIPQIQILPAADTAEGTTT